MNIAAILWSNQASILKEVSTDAGVNVQTLTLKQLKTESEKSLDKWAKMLVEADLALVYKNGGEYDDRIGELAKSAGVPILFLSSDPIAWAEGSFDPRYSADAYRYQMLGGEENMRRLCFYLRSRVGGEDIEVLPPLEGAWEFGWHPDFGTLQTPSELWSELGSRGFECFVGLMISRSNILSKNIAVECALIREYEKAGIGVVPVAYYPVVDEGIGNLSGAQVIENYFCDGLKPKVEAVVKLSSFLLSQKKGDDKKGLKSSGEELLKKLNIPLISPIVSYYKSEQEWRDDPSGLGTQVAFSIAMPEFDGGIEPIIIGANDDSVEGDEKGYAPIDERIQKLVRRTLKWLELRRKPNAQKKVAFVLHNNPCVGAESSVGGGAHLDTLESVAKILGQMKEAGYNVRVPQSGKALIEEILDKKALSEFRFTAVEDIVKCGGALDLLDADKYKKWFSVLPEKTRNRIENSWGAAPGEKKNNIPPAMLYEGKIVISAVEFGNAVVLVQPKRGCAGARCDGEVCLILHDPDVPPPHQYIATYQWLQNEFGADALIHVGTHGNLEFLPGKSTGMSDSCFSDIGVGDMPHLYIYNADNPAEGVIAKRRSYAVTVNHMQTPMKGGGLYGELLELDTLIDEYEKLKNTEKGKAHTVQHIIMSHGGVKQILGDDAKITHENFDDMLTKMHGKLANLRGTYIPRGMHIFGDTPSQDRLCDLVYSTVRWGFGADTVRGIVSRALQIDPETCGDDEINKIDELSKGAVFAFINEAKPIFETVAEEVAIFDELKESCLGVENSISELIRTIQNTDEIGSLFNGFDGGYIAPGPSGLITRGRPDILPTGRNLYSIDPWQCPSKSAWVIGKKLADGLLARYEADSGRLPQNIAFHWQSTDLMWTNGEMYAQLLYLIGCEPIWDQGARVKSFRVISLEELGRARVDITVRVSGITRDNFPNTIELLDEAVETVANLDEPEYLNFVRKHTKEKEAQGLDNRGATARIFCSMPGTYQAGTNLAVYASAWKDEKDLSDIYLFWNSFAYGRGMFGERQVDAFKSSLKTVEATFNKTASDEYDLTGCCCYFGTHGGLINAAKTLRDGEEVKNYYGDTREEGRVGIRTLSEEMRRVVRAKLLNPAWIEGMKEHGYKGASEMSKRIGRVYGWQATSREVDGGIFDDIARTYLMDDDNRAFFEENNPWALEEVGRRLLEAEARGLWEPADDVKEELKERYIEIEGWMEERMGEGEVQGGRIDIMNSEDVSSWKEKMQAVLG